MEKLTKMVQKTEMPDSSLKASLRAASGGTEGAERPEALMQVCNGAKEILKIRRMRRRIGFLSFLRRQIRFIYCKIWLLQTGMLVLSCALLEVVFQDFFLGESRNIARYFAYFLCCLSGAVLFSAVPLIYRSVRYGMYEIELTTRFSSVKLLAAKLFAIGIGNVVILFGILLFTVMRTSLQADSVLLYLLLPYLAAVSGLLYLLGHIPAEKLQVGSVGLGCLLFFILVLLKRFWPAFFGQRFSIEWGIVCLLLLLFCAVQMHYLMHRSMYAKCEENF